MMATVAAVLLVAMMAASPLAGAVLPGYWDTSPGLPKARARFERRSVRQSCAMCASISRR